MSSNSLPATPKQNVSGAKYPVQIDQSDGSLVRVQQNSTPNPQPQTSRALTQSATPGALPEGYTVYRNAPNTFLANIRVIGNNKTSPLVKTVALQRVPSGKAMQGTPKKVKVPGMTINPITGIPQILLRGKPIPAGKRPVIGVKPNQPMPILGIAQKKDYTRPLQQIKPKDCTPPFMSRTEIPPGMKQSRGALTATQTTNPTPASLTNHLVMGTATVELYLRSYSQQLVRGAMQKFMAFAEPQSRKFSDFYSEASSLTTSLEKAYTEAARKLSKPSHTDKRRKQSPHDTSKRSRTSSIEKTAPKTNAFASLPGPSGEPPQKTTPTQPPREPIPIDTPKQSPKMIQKTTIIRTGIPPRRSVEDSMALAVRIPQGTQLTPVKASQLWTRNIKPKYQHPAPLPTHDTGRIGTICPPPKPTLELKMDGTKIVLKFDQVFDLMKIYGAAKRFEIYTYTEGDYEPRTDLWKRLGDVSALKLPMVVTLTLDSKEGFKYHFSVRGIDEHDNIGPFSDAQAIDLRPQITVE